MRTRRFTAIASVLALVFMLVGMVPAGAKPPAAKHWDVFRDKLGAYTCSSAEPKGQTRVAGPYATQAECLATLSTPPTINYALTGTLGSNGWYTSGVSLDWTITDAPGVLPGVMQVTGGVDQLVKTDQQATTYSASATSVGGSAGPVEVSIARDATPPTIVVGPGIVNGDSFEVGSVPAEPTFEASDATSGIDTSSFTGYGTAIGTYTLVGSATDLAGNGASIDPIGYTVYAHQATVVDPSKTDESCNGPGSVVPGGLTIPYVPGIDYFVDGVLATDGFREMPAGVYQVTASAQTDYELVGYLGGWTLEVVVADCIVPVNSVAPTATDETADSMGFISIPAVEGLAYSIDGSPAAGDMYLLPGTYQVTAEALFGYALVGDASWSLTINAYVPPPTPVTPLEPTVQNESAFGTLDGGIVVTAVTGVDYTIDGAPAAPGLNALAPGPYTAEASAQVGYELVGYTGPWLLTVGKDAPPIVEVTPAAPTATDPTAIASGFITIPTSEGVDYALEGVAVVAGNYDRDPGDYLVEASAQPGYALAPGATSSWTLTINPYVPPKQVEFVGRTVGTQATTTITLPAGWQAGDLAVMVIMKNACGSGSPPVTCPPFIPSGWTGLQTVTSSSTATNAVSSRLVYRVLQAGDTGTVSTGSYRAAAVMVYRNAAIGASGVQGSGTSTTLTIPGLTLQNTTGSSWVGAFATNFNGLRTATAPTGMVSRTFDGGGSTTGPGGFDTDGGVTSFAARTIPAGAPWNAYSFELKVTP